MSTLEKSTLNQEIEASCPYCYAGPGEGVIRGHFKDCPWTLSPFELRDELDAARNHIQAQNSQIRTLKERLEKYEI